MNDPKFYFVFYLLDNEKTFLSASVLDKSDEMPNLKTLLWSDLIDSPYTYLFRQNKNYSLFSIHINCLFEMRIDKCH